jgi:two-component system NtrC family sensor kinase
VSADRGHHRGLAARFGLALCAGAALILIAGSYASLRMQRSHLTRMVEERATEVAEVIRSSTREAMMRNDPGEVRQIIHSIVANEAFERIRVFDARGRITVSTVEEEVGALVDQNAEQCVQCHRAGRPLSKVNREDRTRLFRSAAGEPVLGVIAPLHNEASCSNADCHAHPASMSVLGVLDLQLPMAAVEADLAASQRQLLLVVVITLLALLALVWLLTWRMVLRPVATLTQAAQRISSGDFSERISRSSHGEIATLTDEWNAMTERLGEARRELEELNSTLEKRVEEKTAQLSEAHQRMLLVEKLASLGKLAATVAHEINNPLAGIATYAKLLRRRSEDAAGGNPPTAAETDLRRILSLIEEEAHRCGKIVRNLLLFSRASAARFTEDELYPLLDRCVLLLHHRAELAEISLQLDVPADLPKVECDGSQIQQMVLALAINAVEATQAGGNVTISARAEPEGFVTIQVRDNGRGIPKEHLAEIFEPFFTTKEGESGVGLGLPVVYGIATRHHGTVTVDSIVGQGTVFTVRLPLRQPRDASPAAGEKEVEVS